MLIEMSKARRILFYIAAILIGFCGMAEQGVNPAMSGIFSTYGYGAAGSFAASAPTWSMAVFAFLCVPLMAKITKKRLLVVSVAVFTFSAIFAGSVDNYAYFVTMRLLMGAAEGIINTVILAYLAQMFIDQNRHARFVGIWNFVYTLFGAVLAMAGGYFAVPEWTHLFVIFIPSIVVLLTTIVFLPEIGMETAPTGIASPAASESSEKESLGGLYWAFWACFMLFSLGVALYMYFLSELVEVTGMGTYDLTGVLMMIYSLGGAAVSLVFGKLFMKLKKWLSVLNTALLVVSLAALYFCQGNVPVYYVASFVLGISFGSEYAYMYTMVVDLVPASKVDTGIALITGGYSCVYIAISYIVNALRMPLSPDLGVVTPQFLFFAVLMIIPLVIDLATMPAYKRHMARLAAAKTSDGQMS